MTNSDSIMFLIADNPILPLRLKVTQAHQRSSASKMSLWALTMTTGLVMLMLADTSYALSSDREQPANIEADDIEFDLRAGTRTFIDNVIAVQGTLRIKADKLIANYADGELTGAQAWGSLARFKQRPDNEPNDVEGWARKIVVNQKDNTLTLVGNAALRQGMDTIRGEQIIYNMANNKLKVTGGAAVGVANDQTSTTKADPNKKLEDPFKDDPAELPDERQASTAEADDTSVPSTEQVEQKGRRSRLIIQPK